MCLQELIALLLQSTTGSTHHKAALHAWHIGASSTQHLVGLSGTHCLWDSKMVMPTDCGHRSKWNTSPETVLSKRGHTMPKSLEDRFLLQNCLAKSLNSP